MVGIIILGFLCKLRCLLGTDMAIVVNYKYVLIRGLQLHSSGLLVLEKHNKWIRKYTYLKS